jgi:taurine dioxygenase
MPINVTPQPSGFGAHVTGLDLSQPLDAATKAEVLAAWAAHGVLAFPDQPLSLDEQEAFTLALGNFGEDPFVKPMAGHAHILELRREPHETAPNFGSGWHSDWSFQATPPAATILHSKVIPPVGGDTLFADCTAAFAALSPAMQRLCEGLNAVHSAKLPYGRNGAYAKETGTRTMQSMTQDESYALLGFLFKYITQPQFIYRHHWSPETLLIWDNRRMLHFAEGGYDGHLRLLHRTTVAGEVPIAARKAAAA